AQYAGYCPLRFRLDRRRRAKAHRRTARSTPRMREETEGVAFVPAVRISRSNIAASEIKEPIGEAGDDLVYFVYFAIWVMSAAFAAGLDCTGDPPSIQFGQICSGSPLSSENPHRIHGLHATRRGGRDG